MDEEVSIINTNTRNQRIKNFLVDNRKKLILIAMILGLILIGSYSFDKYKTNKNIKTSNKFNSATLEYSKNPKDISIKKLLEVINDNDPTYSPLSLYFIIDNELISDHNKINDLFDIIIEKTSLDKEMKYLVIYKKALFNADYLKENELLKILNPIINSESVWKSHALHLMAEYFYSNNQKQKSKEFFNQIMTLENPNIEIKTQAQKRLNRDLSD